MDHPLLGLEAAGEGDFLELHPGFAQEHFGPFDPLLHDAPTDRREPGGLKASFEGPPVETRSVGDMLNRDWAVGTFADEAQGQFRFGGGRFVRRRLAGFKDLQHQRECPTAPGGGVVSGFRERTGNQSVESREDRRRFGRAKVQVVLRQVSRGNHTVWNEASQADPLFRPTVGGVRPVAMPLTRCEEERVSRCEPGHPVCFPDPATCRDEDQGKIGQPSPAFPGKIEFAGMTGAGVGLPGADPERSCRGQAATGPQQVRGDGWIDEALGACVFMYHSRVVEKFEGLVVKS